MEHLSKEMRRLAVEDLSRELQKLSEEEIDEFFYMCGWKNIEADHDKNKSLTNLEINIIKTDKKLAEGLISTFIQETQKKEIIKNLNKTKNQKK